MATCVWVARAAQSQLSLSPRPSHLILPISSTVPPLNIAPYIPASIGVKHQQSPQRPTRLVFPLIRSCPIPHHRHHPILSTSKQASPRCGPSCKSCCASSTPDPPQTTGSSSNSPRRTSNRPWRVCPPASRG